MILWSTENWTELQRLTVHSSTVIQVNKLFKGKIKFSLDDNYICSVSRDRGTCIHQLNHVTNLYEYMDAVYINKRIVWCCEYKNILKIGFH